jgi:hypothetical protein
VANITTDNFVVSNKGLNPVVNFNFMVRVEGLIDLPCKSVKAFSREMEYELIQEGGVNDYVHMRRKPISRPFTLEIERYTGIDYFDPMPTGLDLVLPLIVFVSRYVNNFIPGIVYRTYIFTGCTVTKKSYGELNAEHSGLLTETTTIAYREMMCVDLPWSELGSQLFADTAETPQTSNLAAEKEKEAALAELDELIKQANELKKKALKLKADAAAFVSGQPAPAEGEAGPDYAGLNNLLTAFLDGSADANTALGAVAGPPEVFKKLMEGLIASVAAIQNNILGTEPNADNCIEIATEGKTKSDIKEIRKAAADAKIPLRKGRLEYSAAESVWNEMKRSASGAPAEVDSDYWKEIAKKQEELAKDPDNQAGAFDEEYWNQTGEPGPDADKPLDPAWAEIAAKEAARLAEERERAEKNALDEDYWDEVSDKQEELAKDADNRAGGDVDAGYWDEVSDKQEELAKDPDNRAGEPDAPPSEGGAGDDGGEEEIRGAAGEPAGGTGDESGDGLSDALSGGEDGGEEQTEP